MKPKEEILAHARKYYLENLAIVSSNEMAAEEAWNEHLPHIFRDIRERQITALKAATFALEVERAVRTWPERLTPNETDPSPPWPLAEGDQGFSPFGGISF